MVPILLGLTSDYAAKLSAATGAGAWSLVVRFQALGPLPSFAPADVTLFAARGSTDANGALLPVVDWAAYPWRPLSTSLNADGSARAHFPDGAVNAAQWSSALSSPGTTAAAASNVDLAITLDDGKVPLTLVVHHAVVQATMAPDGATLTGGNLGGILDTNELVDSFKQYAETSVCCGSLCDGLQGLLSQIRGASDILGDGSQDPAKPCDGVSIGLGFEATKSAIGEPVAPTAAACK